MAIRQPRKRMNEREEKGLARPEQTFKGAPTMQICKQILSQAVGFDNAVAILMVERRRVPFLISLKCPHVHLKPQLRHAW